MKNNLLSLRYDDLSGRALEKKLAAALECGATHTLYTPNAEIAYRCARSPSFGALIARGDFVIPDGEGVILGRRLAGKPFKHGKHAGVELGMQIASLCAASGRSLFLFGGKRGVAELAAKSLRARFPDLIIAGTAPGYEIDPAEVANRIKSSGAGAVFVCLGSPKQEIWIDRYGKKTGAAILAGLGGSMDVYAGITKRAPKLWIDCKVEWLWRLIDDPRRWKRMLKIPCYLLLCLGERFAEKR